MPLRVLLAVLSVLSLPAIGAAALGQPTGVYEIVYLGTLGGTVSFAGVSGARGVVWVDIRPVGRSAEPDAPSRAEAINEAGAVAGAAQTDVVAVSVRRLSPAFLATPRGGAYVLTAQTRALLLRPRG